MARTKKQEVELWRPVNPRTPTAVGVKAEGWEVSNLGNVRRDGKLVELGEREFKFRGKTTRQPAVWFPWEGNVSVPILLTTLVAEAWVPNPHGSRKVCRVVKDNTNTRADNLYWKLCNETTRSHKPYEPDVEKEQWQPVQGAVGYEVSSEGRVRKDGKVIKPLHKRFREPTVFLYYSGKVKGAEVKRLVANAFVPNPMGHGRISRVDGSPDRSCRAADLLWVAEPHGSRRSFRMGRGGSSARAKLTPEIVRDMRRRAAAGERQGDLAAEYGVTPTAVSLAVRGKTWRGV